MALILLRKETNENVDLEIYEIDVNINKFDPLVTKLR